MTMGHIIHYGSSAGYVLVHVPWGEFSTVHTYSIEIGVIFSSFLQFLTGTGDSRKLYPLALVQESMTIPLNQWNGSGISAYRMVLSYKN